MIKELLEKIVFKEKEDVINTKFMRQRLTNNGKPLYDYNFMMNLNEKDYPKYIKKIYLTKMGEKLNLRNPKSINEKIQWLKIYDSTPLKTKLTDKILVKEWAKDKIGNEYVKPSIMICDSFDEIDFNNLPDKFIVKCNHGCKWHFYVKNKEKFLKQENLYNLSKRQMEYWLSHNYFGLSDFEIQYKDIVPHILIEPLLASPLDDEPEQIQIYCFNSVPKIFYRYKRHQGEQKKIIYNTYDEEYNEIDLQFVLGSESYKQAANDYLKQAVNLSKELCKDFKFVRVDWMLSNDKLFFEEMTFTPFSGYYLFEPNKHHWYLKLGKMINLRG